MTYRLLILHLALSLAGSQLGAAPISVPAHNFAIDIPESWLDIAPAPPELALGKHSPDNARRILIIAAKRPAVIRPANLDEIRAGMKDSIIKQGYRDDGGRTVMLAGLPFVAMSAHQPGGESMTAYSAAVGDKLYGISTIRAAGISDDGELTAILQSFHFLANPSATAPAAPPTSDAYRIGYVTGQILLGLLVIGLIWKAFSRR